MPDHVHFLIESDSGRNVLQIIKLYKQITGFAYKQRTGQALWQKSWFDHVLRRDEKVEQMVRYIFENPVRKGLVEDFRNYPFLGTGVEAVKEHLNWKMEV